MESTLTLSRADLQAEVGDEAGFGPSTAWNDSQLTRINKCVNSGLRMVYFTQEMDGIPGGYDWSFLKPTVEITLNSGETDVLLPDDFNGFLADMVPASSSGESQFAVPIRGEADWYKQQAQSSSQTGRPRFACRVSIKGTTHTRSSRSLLKVWPTADQDYTLQIWYAILPDALTEALPYVYGSASHAETFKSAVRYAYERDYDSGGNGSRQADFMVRLRASITADRRMKPQSLGPMLDPSDQPMPGQYRLIGGNPISIGGITPGVA